MADIYNVLANIFKKNMETVGVKVDADALANKVAVTVTKSNVANRIRENLARDLQRTAQPVIRRQIIHGLTNDGRPGMELESTRRMYALLNIIPMSKSYGALYGHRWIKNNWGGDWYKYKAQLTSNRLRSRTGITGIDARIENNYRQEDLGQIRRQQRLRKKQGRTRVGESSRLSIKLDVEKYTVFRVDAVQVRRPKRRQIDQREENRQRKAWKEQGGTSADFVYKEPASLKRSSTTHRVYVDETLDITDHRKKIKGKKNDDTVEGFTPTIESTPYRGRSESLGFNYSSFMSEQDDLKSDLKKIGIKDPHATARALLVTKMMRKAQTSRLKYSSRNGGKVYNIPYAKTGLLASQLAKSFVIHKVDHEKVPGARSGVFQYKAIYSLNPHKMPYDVQEAWKYSRTQYKSVVIEGTSDIMREYLFKVVADKFGEKYVR